jgi:hypothetical protein
MYHANRTKEAHAKPQSRYFFFCAFAPLREIVLYRVQENS